MAYKFQLGTAKLSGSVQLTDGSIDSTEVNDATAANIVTQIDDGEIGHTKVALENGDILIGDANGFAQNQTMSGDATLAAGGALTIADEAVTYAKMQHVSATARILGRNSSGAGDVEELTKANVLTMINAEDGATADQTAVEIIGLLNSDLGGNFSIGNQASDSLTLAGALVVGGDLTVQGTTTSVNSTTINISSSFTFEGPADDHETTLAVGVPTQDLQINLPQFSASAGAATYHLPVLADATTAAAAAVTAAEFALLDGGTARGTSALADGDGFMHNDAGTMKHTNVLQIAEYSYAKISSDATVAF